MWTVYGYNFRVSLPRLRYEQMWSLFALDDGLLRSGRGRWGPVPLPANIFHIEIDIHLDGFSARQHHSRRHVFIVRFYINQICIKERKRKQEKISGLLFVVFTAKKKIRYNSPQV